MKKIKPRLATKEDCKRPLRIHMPVRVTKKKAESKRQQDLERAAPEKKGKERAE